MALKGHDASDPMTVRKYLKIMNVFSAEGDYSMGRENGIIRILHTIQAGEKRHRYMYRDKSKKKEKNTTDGLDFPAIDGVFYFGSEADQAGCVHQTEGRLTRLSHAINHNDRRADPLESAKFIMYFNI
jgi:YD repeat-containing protein